MTDPAAPNDQVTYIARIDFGGGVEVPTDGPHVGDTDPTKHRDSTVVTIADVSETSEGGHPITRMVETN